jgi:hypothetical protein
MLPPKCSFLLIEILPHHPYLEHDLVVGRV